MNVYDLEELTVTIHLSLVPIAASAHQQSQQIQVVCGGPALFIWLKVNAFCNNSLPRQYISIKILSKRRRKRKKKKPDSNIWLSSRSKDNFHRALVVLRLQLSQKVHSRFPTRQNFKKTKWISIKMNNGRMKVKKINKRRKENEERKYGIFSVKIDQTVIAKE